METLGRERPEQRRLRQLLDAGLLLHPSILPDVGELDEWRHCPRCGADVQPDRGRVECAACGYRAYASSKPTATALVVDDRGRILLARRAHEPYAGLWDLPGGFLDEGEEPLDALRRELREETGVEVEPGAFFGIVVDRYGGDDDARSTLNLYWLARVVDGDPRPADDVTELRWFGPDELPDERRLAFRNNARVLAAWRAGKQQA
jgi:8-oxo-dGTP diphosphatase